MPPQMGGANPSLHAGLAHYLQSAAPAFCVICAICGFQWIAYYVNFPLAPENIIRRSGSGVLPLFGKHCP